MTMPGFTAEAALDPAGGRHRTAGPRGDSTGRRGVRPQARARDDWTTSSICKACGCTVSGFVCNCGLRPRPDKLECIRNGGPKKRTVMLLR
jgi:hypothetical protein